MADSIPCELVLDAHAPLAESPLWDAQTGTLLWVDIERGEIHRFDPEDRSDRVWNVDLGVTAIALREQDGLLATTPHGFAFVELQEHAALIEVIPTPELTPEGVRMNDAKVGPAGRLWAGSTGDSTDPVAALFCLDGELQVREVLEGVTESNGLGWSPAETSMYHVDSNAGKVNVYDYDKSTGEIANPRPLVTTDIRSEVPDGLAVDTDGGIWVAFWNGSQVRRVSPSGDVLAVIDLPCKQVTSCAFGGPGLYDLYITTAAFEIDSDEAAATHAGGIFHCRPDVRGQTVPRFAG